MSDLADLYLTWLLLWFIVGGLGYCLARLWLVGPMLNRRPGPYEQYMPRTVRVVHDVCFWMLVDSIFILVAVDATTRWLGIR